MWGLIWGSILSKSPMPDSPFDQVSTLETLDSMVEARGLEPLHLQTGIRGAGCLFGVLWA